MSHHSSISERRGLTLVELLIVIAIIMVLLSVAVPLISVGLQGKKVREASRQLNAFVALAKARAAERNRPVGIYFERTPGNLNQVLTVYLAEVQPPYVGDSTDAKCYIRRNPNLPAPDAGSWELVFEQSTSTMLRNTRNILGVNEIAQVRFRPSGPMTVFVRKADPGSPNAPDKDYYLVLSFPGGMPPLGSWRDTDGGWGRGGFNDGMAYSFAQDSIDEMGWPAFPGMGITPPNDAYDTMTQKGDMPVGLSYWMFRRPKKLSAAPLEMPPGTAIDLSLSGISSSGVEFDAWRPTINPNPPPFPDGRDIIVLFSPGGGVASLYSGGVASDPLGTMHFLVGRHEQIQPLDALTPCAPINPKVSDGNYVDPESLWVSIGPITGHVTTTEIYVPRDGVDNDSDGEVDELDELFAISMSVKRTVARTAQSMGGRGG